MKLLNQLLFTHTNKSSWLGFVALFIGVFILFLSVQFYINAHQLLFNPSQQQDGFTYLVVNKKITNSMMGNNLNSSFTKEEIDTIQQLKSIDQLGIITSNRYSITANTLGQLAFSTELFFESVPDDYLDIKPEHWYWKPGDQSMPIIISSDYLNLYNFGFALSQGLPQMSEETIKAIPFNITIYNSTSEEKIVANVVGFTQRYSSVLVPQEFMQYANSTYGEGKLAVTSRIILKTKEPDNPELVRFLDEHQYATQNEKLKSSKLKSIVNIIFGACGFMGFFVLVLSLLLIVMYIKILILHSSSKLHLLHVLGYKITVLQKQFTQPIYNVFFIVVLSALLISQCIQWILAIQLKPYHIELNAFVAWQIILLALILLVISYFWLRKKVSSILSSLISSM